MLHFPRICDKLWWYLNSKTSIDNPHPLVLYLKQDLSLNLYIYNAWCVLEASVMSYVIHQRTTSQDMLNILIDKTTAKITHLHLLPYPAVAITPEFSCFFYCVWYHAEDETVLIFENFFPQIGAIICFIQRAVPRSIHINNAFITVCIFHLNLTATQDCAMCNGWVKWNTYLHEVNNVCNHCSPRDDMYLSGTAVDNNEFYSLLGWRHGYRNNNEHRCPRTGNESRRMRTYLRSIFCSCRC